MAKTVEITTDARFDILRDSIRANAAEHAQGSLVVDGVSSAKVRAFTSVMLAAQQGYVFEGQAEMLARDWAAASGQALAEASVKSAASKVGVWIKAGRSNCATGVVEAMTDLARGNGDKSKRFFEKCCTGMRRSLKEGRPLTEVEMDGILLGESDAQPDPLADLCANLKRIVTAYAAIVEANPSNTTFTQLHADAVGRHALVEGQIKNRGVQKVSVAAPVVAPVVTVTPVPSPVVNSAEQLIANVMAERSEKCTTDTALSAALAAAMGSDVASGLFVTA